MKSILFLMKPLSVLFLSICLGSSLGLTKEKQSKIQRSYLPDNIETLQEADYCSVKGSGDYQAVKFELEGIAAKPFEFKSDKVKDYQLVEEVIQIKKEGSFEVFVTHSNGYSRTLIWIDWNGDGDFIDPKEFQKPLGKGSFFSGEGKPTYSSEIKISKRLIQSGIIRMRVVTGDAWGLDDDKIPHKPCGQLFNATVKDFRLLIL